MGYAKLFSSIVHSTIWREEAHVKVVWITMLAIADRTGVVEASLPGLADAAKVSVEQCRHALGRLQAPDPDSRTKDYDGRRVEEMDGGWLVLNYEKHRAKKDLEEERAQARERAKRYRASRAVTERHGASRHVTVSAKPAPAPAPEAEAESVGSSSVISLSTRNGSRVARATTEAVHVEAEVVKSENWTAEAGDIWKARFGGTSKYGLIGRELKPLVDEHGWPAVKAVWIKYLATLDDSRYASPHHFATVLFGKLAGIRRDPPPRDDVTAHNASLVDDATWRREMAKMGQAVNSMPKLKG